MGQCSRTRGACGLNVEFLQDLHGKHEVSSCEQVESAAPLCIIVRRYTDCIDEHVSVNEAHRSRATRRAGGYRRNAVHRRAPG